MRNLIFFGLILNSILCLNPIEDEVKEWPFYPQYNFKTYSGFVEIYEGKQKIHYIFMESIESPENKPLIVWYGGGPGCSCMLGLISEIGPFVREKFSQEFVYTENPYSLHKLGNILYLDIPAGVGYSELHDEDYEWSDTNTGIDSYEAIKTWLDGFQDYKDREMWIGGESYSGMYVPCTAEVIVKKNKEGQNRINLKGILVGNGVLVNDDDFFDLWNREYMIKRNFYDIVTQNVMHNSCQRSPQSASCQRALETQAIVMKDLNPYDVYGYCYGDSSIKQKGRYRSIRDSEEAPCIDVGPLNNFFNNPEVKKKLRIPEERVWEACSMEVFFGFHRDKDSHVLMKYLFENGIKILQYSGNSDDIVSIDYTLASLKLIDGITLISRTPFANNETKQLAGWIMEYNYLTLYIIRGAGHLVPYDQRANAFQMFQEFISRQ
ncbi:unnamed protein product [Paramecium primaurelia]|uniref:Carboxypeptidase n=1 Tax=Paramecium primaurelia TaxID=5886 RepID=A0A8S1PUY6_PARPR|nr:unnamed protein product [Paramecium primaurelia]